MTIYEVMQVERMEAMRRKDKNVKGLLTVFIGDMQTLEKRGTVIDDTLVIQQIKKAIANSDENLKIRHNEQDELTIEVLSAYLPKQMTEDELSIIINDCIAQGASLGQIMGHLKKHYGGLYDGKLAANLAKEMIG